MSELTTKFGVHSTQIALWKRQLLEEGLKAFKEATKGKKDNHQELVGRLYQQIGQLQVELDRRAAPWLKKTWLGIIPANYPKPNLSKANPEHKIYPYLLRGVKIKQVNQVWTGPPGGTDITAGRPRYIPMEKGLCT